MSKLNNDNDTAVIQREIERLERQIEMCEHQQVGESSAERRRELERKIERANSQIEELRKALK